MLIASQEKEQGGGDCKILHSITVILMMMICDLLEMIDCSKKCALCEKKRNEKDIGLGFKKNTSNAWWQVQILVKRWKLDPTSRMGSMQKARPKYV